MDTKRPRRNLNDPTPDEWTAASRTHPVGSRGWYQEQEEKPYEGYFKGRSSASFVPADYDSNKESEGNPKARVGAMKVPMHLVPPVATVHLAMALEDGAKKYGAFNYRSEQINVSTYIGAIHRHLAAYQDGEDFAADSGVHHIAAVLAGGAILLDCLSMGNLVDDRPVSSNAAKLIAEWRSK